MHQKEDAMNRNNNHQLNNKDNCESTPAKTLINARQTLNHSAKKPDNQISRRNDSIDMSKLPVLNVVGWKMEEKPEGTHNSPL